MGKPDINALRNQGKVSTVDIEKSIEKSQESSNKLKETEKKPVIKRKPKEITAVVRTNATFGLDSEIQDDLAMAALRSKTKKYIIVEEALREYLKKHHKAQLD